MAEKSETRDPVEELAEDFLTRRRRGERPSILDYARQHPLHAGRIRELFPALLLMEDLKPDSQPPETTGQDRPASPGAIPERLGDFRILGEIGRGGMGVVYEAVQESLGRRVALKVLPETLLASPQATRRFRREAQAAARLHHTNIVPVFGVGEHEGKHYYVMQFIQGCSLDRVLGEVIGLRSRTPQDEAPTEPDRADRPRRPCDSAPVELARSMLRGHLKATSPQPGDPRRPDPRDPDPTSELPTRATAVSPGADMPEGETDDNRAAIEPPSLRGRVENAGVPPSGGRWRKNPHSLPAEAGTPTAANRISGHPLSAFASPNRAYWRSVAGLGVQVAGALHYAHKQGVLHRDVKPANLLLDHQGSVWITDFGLAKLAEHDDLTDSGDMVGTLRYMAPEQWEGEPDSRSDVYTLGLTLYELLTFRPAFDATSRGRLIRQVAQGDPPRPRAVNAEIPRDLETIVLKAIARAPGHRYRTAGDMADDLRRFLEDRPIRARRTSAIEHAWRWCRRNPALAGTTATAVLLLVALAAGASFGYVRRTQALRVQSELRARAESESLRAEANLQLAANAFEEVFARIGEVPLPQVLDESDDEVWYSTASPAVVNKKDVAVLQSLLKFYDQFADQNRESVRWLHDSARAYRRVGEIQQLLGRLPEAEEAYGRARESYERLRESAPEDPEYLVGLAGVHNELGEIVRVMGRFPEAVAAHRQALALLTGQPHTGSTRAAARFELARTYDALGFAATIRRFGPPRPGAHAIDDVDPADCCRRALEILEELVAEDPANGDYRFATAQCYQHLSHAARGGWRGPHRRPPPQRAAYSEEAIRLVEQLIADFPESPRYVCQLALIFASPVPFRPDSDEAARSIGRLERAVEMMEDLVGSYPDVPEYRSTLALCCSALADRLWQRGEVDQAGARYGRSVELCRPLVAEFPVVHRYRFTLSRSLRALAETERLRSDPEAARRLLEELIETETPSLEEPEQKPPAGPPAARVLADAYQELSEVLSELHESALAAEASQKAQELRQKLPRRPGWFPLGRPGPRRHAEPPHTPSAGG